MCPGRGNAGRRPTCRGGLQVQVKPCRCACEAARGQVAPCTNRCRLFSPARAGSGGGVRRGRPCDASGYASLRRHRRADRMAYPVSGLLETQWQTSEQRNRANDSCTLLLQGSPDYIHVKGCISRGMSLSENLSHPLDWSHIQYTIFCNKGHGPCLSGRQLGTALLLLTYYPVPGAR
jgi:hypothetical protein